MQTKGEKWKRRWKMKSFFFLIIIEWGDEKCMLKKRNIALVHVNFTLFPNLPIPNVFERTARWRWRRKTLNTDTRSFSTTKPCIFSKNWIQDIKTKNFSLSRTRGLFKAIDFIAFPPKRLFMFLNIYQQWKEFCSKKKHRKSINKKHIHTHTQVEWE